MRIFKKSDKINLNIDTLTFGVSPLTFKQKSEINSCTKRDGGVEVQDSLKMVFLGVKYCVKEVSGLETMDGKKYELEFDGDVLSDDCVDELLNLEISNKLGTAAMNFLNFIPTMVTGVDGKEIEGVSVEFESGGVKKKR